MYGNAADVGYVRFYSDERGFYDDILVTDVGKAYLTVMVDPGFINTTTPLPGVHEYTLNVDAAIDADDYVTCPDTYVFDYWEGAVANTGSASTTIYMDTNKSVTAHYVINNKCGDDCHTPPESDLTEDCYVGLDDFALLAAGWLNCTAPACD